VSTDVVLLVPPSLSKTPGARSGPTRDGLHRYLAPERRALLDALRHELDSLSLVGAEKLFKASGALAKHARATNRALVEQKPPLMAAWARYSGVVWEHLDPGTLDDEALRKLLVPSAVYGVNLATDTIADHRLSFQATLRGLGNLAGFWRPAVTTAIARGARGRVVLDLLPGEHAGAIDHTCLGAEVELRRVRFLSPEGQKPIGHGAKAAKGKLARWLLEEGLEGAAAFAWDGWHATWQGPTLEVVASPFSKK